MNEDNMIGRLENFLEVLDSRKLTKITLLARDVKAPYYGLIQEVMNFFGWVKRDGDLYSYKGHGLDSNRAAAIKLLHGVRAAKYGAGFGNPNGGRLDKLSARVDQLAAQTANVSDLMKGADCSTLLAVVEKLASKVDLLSARLAALEGAPTAEKEWLTVREVAVLLNFSESRIYQLCYAGRLTPVKRGRMYLFNREQVENFEHEP